MKTVSDVLARKGRDVWSISPDESIFEAITVMARKNIGALMVIEDTNLLGIVSERDYARRVVLRNRSSKSTHVREIMTTNVTSVTPQQTIEICMSLMTHNSFRHLPVVEKGGVVGVLSMPDLVREIVEEQKSKTHQLESNSSL